jgi:putative ABC transport system substrate-binding protein
LTEGLRELGYEEGVTFHWEDAFADLNHERLPELATALVQRPVDVILAVDTRAALAARDATSTLPIVMGFSGDPVAIGLVASLARPGGNVTGMSSISPQMSGKRLELVRDALPGTRRVAVLWNAAEPVKALDYRETEAASQKLDLTLLPLPVYTADEFESAFEDASRERVDAFIVLGDMLTSGVSQGHAKRLADLAVERRLPLMHEPRATAVAGALLTYGRICLPFTDVRPPTSIRS